MSESSDRGGEVSACISDEIAPASLQHPARTLRWHLILPTLVIGGAILSAVDGPTVSLATHILLLLILICAADTDLRTYLIPNVLVAAIIVEWVACAVCLAMCLPMQEWLAWCFDCLAAALLVGGGLLTFAAVYGAVAKRSSLGGGDVKLLFAVSLYFGVEGAAANLFLACGFSIPLALLWNARCARIADVAQNASDAQDAESARGASGARNEGVAQASGSPKPSDSFLRRPFPFAPAICVATFVSLLMGLSTL